MSTEITLTLPDPVYRSAERLAEGSQRPVQNVLTEVLAEALAAWEEESTTHIEMTPNVRGGRPRIAGTRITVADVALMYLRLGQSLEEIAGKYDLELADVYAAMAYYYDHRAEIDEDIERDEAFAAAFQRQNPSLVQAKLRALPGG
jgi:uncharacterized protein (DUF433 family)